MEWTRNKLLDLIEFTRASGSCYGITNIYDHFLEKEASTKRGWYVVSYRPADFNSMEVLSVKRLSDGEIFSLGDHIELEYDANDDRIESFDIVGDACTLLYDSFNGVDIKSAKKFNAKNKKMYTEADLESAFNFGRDKLFNRDKTFRRYRFGNFQHYLNYVEDMKKLSASIQSKNNNV